MTVLEKAAPPEAVAGTPPRHTAAWLLTGTGVRAGSRLPGLVGDEYDRVQPTAPRPPRVEVLLHSPVRCRGASFADTTYYTARSRAGEAHHAFAVSPPSGLGSIPEGARTT